MPVVAQDPNNKKNDPNNPTPQTGAANISGAQSGNLNSANQVKAKKVVGSGNFTDVSKYQKANQGSAQNLSTGLSKNFQNKANTIQNQVNNNVNTLNTSLNQNKTNLMAKKKALGSIIKNAGTNNKPVSTADIKSFQDFTKGNTKYNTSNYNDTKQRAESSKLFNQSQMLQRADARKSLLRQSFGDGNRRYTIGQNSLDQAILGGNKQATSSLINNSRNYAKNLSSSINKSRENAISNIDSENARYNTALNDINGQVTTGNNTVANDIAARKKYLQGVVSDLRSGKGNARDLYTKLGLDPSSMYDYGQLNTYGVDPTAVRLSDSRVANQDQLSRLQGLATLTGQEQNIIADTGVVGDIGQNKIMRDISNNKTGYNKDKLAAVNTGVNQMRDARKALTNLQNTFNRRAYSSGRTYDGYNYDVTRNLNNDINTILNDPTAGYRQGWGQDYTNEVGRYNTAKASKVAALNRLSNQYGVKGDNYNTFSGQFV